jgi:hypothetical protein
VPIATTGKIVKVSLWRMSAGPGNKKRDLIPLLSGLRKDVQSITH